MHSFVQHMFFKIYREIENNSTQLLSEEGIYQYPLCWLFPALALV